MHAPDEPQEDEGFWSEGRFRLAAYIGTAGAFLFLLSMRFDGAFALPPKPKPPAAPSARVLDEMKYNADYYREILLEDSRKFALNPPASVEEMGKRFPYENLEQQKRLAPGGTLDLGTLKLTARVEKRDNWRDPHLVLRIENTTDQPVAYSVQTSTGRDPARCLKKANLQHNAMAIPARQFVDRTECMYREGMEFAILRVETVRLPALSYHYVSRLDPLDLVMDERASKGHEAPAGGLCKSLNNQIIRVDMQRQKVSWRDIIDFYARHRCEEYAWPRGYRAFNADGQYTLPVSAQMVGAGGL